MPEEPAARELNWPKTGTNAASAYFEATSKNLGLFHFFLDLVVRSDFVGYLIELGPFVEKREYEDPLAMARTGPGVLLQQLKKQRQQFVEMFLARSVDNFERYLVDLVREVLKKQPAILKTAKSSITVEHALSFSRMEDLVEDIIERRISSLAYQGFSELKEWAADRGIPIFVPAGHEDDIAEFIATRNIIVHNRSRVDERYLRTVKNPEFARGELRLLGSEDLSKAIRLVNDAVAGTDDAAAKKFGLEIVHFGDGRQSATG